MKKILPIIIVVIVIIGVMAIYFAIKNDDSPTATTKTPAVTFKVVKACDALSIDNAKAIIGGDAKIDETASKTDKDTNDISLTHCKYVSASGTVSVQSRSAKDQSGLDSNKMAFKLPTKPKGMKDIANLGELAYWDSRQGQLHILKNNNWYIIQVGSSNSTERTIDKAKQAADQIINNL